MLPFIRNSSTLESGSELRSPQRMMGTPGIPGTGVLHPMPLSLCTFITMESSSFMSMMVWMSLTSEYSGSQWMWAVATRRCWGIDCTAPEASLSSSRAPMPMLSLSMTLFSMASEPSAWATASWLNSMRYCSTRENLWWWGGGQCFVCVCVGGGGGGNVVGGSSS